MIVPEQLRAIADELEQAERYRLQAMGELRALLDGANDAGAPMGLGSVGPSGAGEGGEQPTEPHPVDEDVASDGERRKRSGPSRSRRQAKPTGQDGVGQESAPTAEGSTRTFSFKCRDCDYSGQSAQSLGAHRRYRHPGPRQVAHSKRSFLCDLCPMSFKTELDRDTHRASHPAPDRGKPVGRPTVGHRGWE